MLYGGPPLDEKAPFGWSYLDLDIFVHSELVAQSLGDSDLSTFGYSHVALV